MPSLSTNLNQKPSQKPVNTMRLYNIINVMNAIDSNALEFSNQIHHEIAQNPALEFEEGRFCPKCHTKLSKNSLCPVCSYGTPTPDPNDPIVFISPPRMSFRQSNAGQDYSPEEFIAQKESLDTYVLKQIANDIPPKDKKIVDFLLSFLDDTGLLNITMEEVIINQKITRSHLEEIISLINSAEPIGVGSFTPQQAMIYQVKHLHHLSPIEDHALIIAAIQDHMKLIAMQDYASLADHLNIAKTHAQSIAEFISNNLNPYPAHAFWGDQRTVVETKHHAYYQPDFIIHVDHQHTPPKLIVEVLYPIYGNLNLNPAYENALKNKAESKQVTKEVKEKLKNDINQAKTLLNTIEQRNNTLVRFIHWVVKIQHDFILYGEKYLFPLTQKEVAEKLDVEESTISRAVKGKTVQLPSKKIIPCSLFFEKNLPIRIMINEIIANEDKTKPLSDQKICDRLQKEGIQIARRTVAKYRDMEGHLNASGRKKRK